jgi:hypothetical protein
MTISQLIESLEAIKAKHGDVSVIVSTGSESDSDRAVVDDAIPLAYSGREGFVAYADLRVGVDVLAGWRFRSYHED